MNERMKDQKWITIYFLHSFLVDNKYEWWW